MNGAKLVSLPPTGHANTDKDVADFLREMAGAIESGNRERVRQLVMIIESAGELEVWVVGGPCDNARLVGLLAMATSKSMVQS